MFRAQRLLVIGFAACFTLNAQQRIPLDLPSKPIFEGRIVLYDWAAHETSANEDFVIKTLPQSSTANYVRIVYKPFWGFDAPGAAPKDILNRLAFVGRGAAWRFVVHAPSNDEQKASCTAPIVNHKYEDEGGSGELPRFIPTPGGSIEGMGPIEKLQCFILEKDGAARLTAVNKKLR